jgi:glyoxylase-like metal-dependent hydrolase (beta-lactamase superfamily II)
MVEVTKITSEVFQVGGAQLTSPEDASIYLIVLDGHAALVDVGCGRSLERLFNNVPSCGVEPEKIEYLLLTHCHYDHTGGAAKLRKATKCQVVAHELDAEFLEKGDDTVTAANCYGATLDPLLIDRKICGPREVIDLGQRHIKAIHTPGHSPGSVVYLVESEKLKVLFGQDVHGPLDATLLSNREDYLHSLAHLVSLQSDILCEGHFGIYRGKDTVENYIRSYIKSAWIKRHL